MRNKYANYTVFYKRDKVDGFAIGIERYEAVGSPLYNSVMQATGAPVTYTCSMLLPAKATNRQAIQAVIRKIHDLENSLPNNEATKVRITSQYKGVNIGAIDPQLNRAFKLIGKKEIKGSAPELADMALMYGAGFEEWLFKVDNGVGSEE
ncbi:hypothetical protein [Priestia megaterium]|uniref:hypothetical protein n=1 Tax=Priestia megaterium TaxID=1404 RepID=UPI002E1FEF41|nr:hypothetical protein [Priestia megaterium]